MATRTPRSAEMPVNSLAEIASSGNLDHRIGDGNSGALAGRFLKDPGKMLNGGKSAFQSDITDGQIGMAQQRFCMPDAHFCKKFMNRITCLEIEKLGEAASGEPYFLGEFAECPIFPKLGFKSQSFGNSRMDRDQGYDFFWFGEASTTSRTNVSSASRRPQP